MGMYIKVHITEPCVTPQDDWQSIFFPFNFLLLIFFMFEYVIERWQIEIKLKNKIIM